MKILQILSLICLIIMMTASQAASKEIIAVAGATGRTGIEVVKILQSENKYKVRALIRNEKKARKMVDEKTVEIVKVDVKKYNGLEAALKGAKGLVITIGTGGDWFGDNGPEFVDYGGVKNLVNAAKSQGVEHVVLVSSMGITKLDHPLNKRFNNILVWKFLGEESLRKSGLSYTIVRPGGLANGPGGKFGIRFGQGDNMGQGRINRTDVAMVCVKALFNSDADKKTFEILNGGPGNVHWEKVFFDLKADGVTKPNQGPIK